MTQKIANKSIFSEFFSVVPSEDDIKQVKRMLNGEILRSAYADFDYVLKNIKGEERYVLVDKMAEHVEMSFFKSPDSIAESVALNNLLYKTLGWQSAGNLVLNADEQEAFDNAMFSRADLIQLPKFDAKEPLKLIKKRVNKCRIRTIERCAYLNKEVQYGKSHCVSDYVKAVHKNKLERMRAWRKKSYFKSGDQVVCMPTLEDTAKRNIAELIARMKGLEYYAEKKGNVHKLFLTLTLPPEYHINPQYKNKIHEWNGFASWESREEMQIRWEKMYDNLKKEFGSGLNFIKAFEPHKDATPHLHALFFMRPEYDERFREIVHYYFPKLDFDCPDEDDRRTNIREINKEKYERENPGKKGANGVTYVLKYVLKSKFDDLTFGKDNTKGGDSGVRAWTSLCDGRSFVISDLKGAITVWRELRRIKKDTAAYEVIESDELVLKCWQAATGYEAERCDYGVFLECYDQIIENMGAIEKANREYQRLIKRISMSGINQRQINKKTALEREIKGSGIKAVKTHYVEKKLVGIEVGDKIVITHGADRYNGSQYVYTASAKDWVLEYDLNGLINETINDHEGDEELEISDEVKSLMKDLSAKSAFDVEKMFEEREARRREVRRLSDTVLPYVSEHKIDYAGSRLDASMNCARVQKKIVSRPDMMIYTC